MALRDKRRLGRAVIEPDFSHVGPDAAEVGRDVFRDRVGRGTAPLKARLLDQGVIAGVGNLLADETLWRAKLSPRRLAGELSAEELDRLRRELRAATRDAIRNGGVHTGRFMPSRERGGTCPRCGTPLARDTDRRPDDVLVPGLPALTLSKQTGRTWILDTETKGTGAQMVPLDKVVKQPESPGQAALRAAQARQPKPPPEAGPAPAAALQGRRPLQPRGPRRGHRSRATLDLLAGIRSSVDVNVSVWEPSTDAWRLLTLREQATALGAPHLGDCKAHPRAG